MANPITVPDQVPETLHVIQEQPALNYGFNFQLTDADNLRVTVGGAAVAESLYTVNGINEDSGYIQFARAEDVPGQAQEQMRIYRETPVERSSGYTNAGDVTADSLNRDENQQIRILQEVIRDMISRGGESALQLQRDLDMNGFDILNLQGLNLNNNEITGLSRLDMNFNPIINIPEAADDNSPTTLRQVREMFPFGAATRDTSLTLPAVEYGSGQIVDSDQVNIPAGRYPLNQVVRYQNVSLRFAGTVDQLPYSLSQTFRQEDWVPAHASIFETRPIVINPTAGQTRLSPTDGQGNPYNISSVQMTVDGTPQFEGVHFDISPDTNHLDLQGWAFTGNETVYLVINHFRETQVFTSNVVNTLVVQRFSDIATIDTRAYPGLEVIFTLGHTDQGIGAAKYIKTPGATPDTGYASATLDAVVFAIDLDSQGGVVMAEQFGADPRNQRESHTQINAMVQFLAAQAASGGRCTHGVIGSGQFRIRGTAIQIPPGNGFKVTGQGRGTILDARDSTTAFNVIDAPASVNEGIQISGLRIWPSNVAGSWAVRWERCRNNASLRFIWIGEGALGSGANGIFVRESWYNGLQFIFIRNMHGHGILTQSDDDTTGVNGITIGPVFLNGNFVNIELRGADNNSRSTAITLTGTSERSRNTSMKVQYITNLNLDNWYMEGNFQTATAADVTDIEMVNATVNWTSGLLRLADSAHADAPAIKGTEFAVIGFDRQAAWSQPSGRNVIIDSDTQELTDFLRRTGTSVPYFNLFSALTLAGQAVKLLNYRVPYSFARMTTLPVGLASEGNTGLSNIVEYDCTTSINREVWLFRVLLVDTTQGLSSDANAVRYGAQVKAVVVRKEGNSYTHEEETLWDIRGANNAHAVISVLRVDGVITFRVNSTASGVDTSNYRIILLPGITGRNDRLRANAGDF